MHDLRQNYEKVNHRESGTKEKLIICMMKNVRQKY